MSTRKWFGLASVMALAMAYASARPPCCRAEDAPAVYLDRTSLILTARQHSGTDADLHTTWTPDVAFDLHGPTPAGSALTAEFTQGDKSWMTLELQTPRFDDKGWTRVHARDMSDQNVTTYIGPVGFKIHVANALTGADQVLASGSFKVARFHVGYGDRDKFHYCYYVDHDWTLPFGRIVLTPAELPANSKQLLAIQMWFSGKKKLPVGYLMYNGRAVATTENYEADGGNEAESSDPSDHSWRTYTFSFNVWVAGSREPENFDQEPYLLYKNPGEYELKVLLDKKLVRSSKFTVGADGKIVDNGLITKAKLGATGYLLPVEVVSNPVPWDTEAWKTGAFYGLLVEGFTAPGVQSTTPAATAAAAGPVPIGEGGGSVEQFKKTHAWMDLPGFLKYTATGNAEVDAPQQALAEAKHYFGAFFEKWADGNYRDACLYAHTELKKYDRHADWSSDPVLVAAKPCYDEMRDKVIEYAGNYDKWQEPMDHVFQTFSQTLNMLENFQQEPGNKTYADLAKSFCKDLEKALNQAAEAKVGDSMLIQDNKSNMVSIGQVRARLVLLKRQIGAAVDAARGKKDAHYAAYAEVLSGDKLQIFKEEFESDSLTEPYGRGHHGKVLKTPHDFASSDVWYWSTVDRSGLIPITAVEGYKFEGMKKVGTYYKQHPGYDGANDDQYP